MAMRLLIAPAVFALAGMAAPAMAEQGQSTRYDSADQFREYCELAGGWWIVQPYGSWSTECCFEDGCQVCDRHGEDCHWSDLDSHARIDGFSQPQVAAPPGQSGPTLNLGGGGAVFSPSFGN